MRLLVDQNLSEVLAGDLRAAGHDVVHTVDLGLDRADDDVIIDRAARDDRVVVSADTDFGTILAATRAARPSVVLIRLRSPRSAHELAALVLANLDAVQQALEDGAVVVLEDERVRVRTLPLR